MATFDFTLDETSVGQMLTPEDGHVTALAMTTPPPYETPEWDEGRRVWKHGYFVLRGQHDLRDLICVQPAVCGHAFSWVGTVANIVVDGNLPYRGGLIVVAVPKNSQWTLTLRTSQTRASRPPRRRCRWDRAMAARTSRRKCPPFWTADRRG
jgi:hypothetical protein